MGAARHPLCRSKLNRTNPPGLRRTDQKSLLVRVVLAETTGGAMHFILVLRQ